MKRVYWVLTLCFVLSCTHAVRVQRSVLQAPSASVSTRTCPRSSIMVSQTCYPAPAISRQVLTNESASLGRALTEAIEQVENGGNVSTIAATFSQVLTRAYSRIVSNSVLDVIDPENEDICRYTGQAAPHFATAIGEIVVRTLARSGNEYARAGAQCVASAVGSASVRSLHETAYGECTNFEAEFVYNRLVIVGYTATNTRYVSMLLTGVVERDAIVAAGICEGGGSPTTVVTSVLASRDQE